MKIHTFTVNIGVVGAYEHLDTADLIREAIELVFSEANRNELRIHIGEIHSQEIEKIIIKTEEAPIKEKNIKNNAGHKK